MITIKNISKSYSTKGTSKKVLDDVSLSFKESEIYGIIGESGAGKTTLLRLLLGLENPDIGKIQYMGSDLSTNNFIKQMRQITSVVFQDYNLLNNKNCYDNVALPLKIQKNVQPKAITDALEFVGLSGFEKQYPATLSGGEKQRLAIARALVTKPRLLICDEPTAALDHQSTIRILNLLKEIHKNYGTTIIIVTHDLKFAKNICHKVALFEKGHLIDVINNQNKLKELPSQSYSDYAKEVFQ